MTIHYFHGGCIGCVQQERHGVDFCFDCKYFEPDWSKPSLFEDGLTPVEDVRRKVRERREKRARDSNKTQAQRILRDPASRRELLIELCREQLLERHSLHASYEEAAAVYDDLLARQFLQGAR